MINANRRSARTMLLACAMAGAATLSGCAGIDATAPTAHKPAPTISYDDTCSSGWVVVNGQLVCQGI